jgi:hypothetical protein
MQLGSAQGAANLLAAPVPVPRRAVRNLRKVGSFANCTRYQLPANEQVGFMHNVLKVLGYAGLLPFLQDVPSSSQQALRQGRLPLSGAPVLGMVAPARALAQGADVFVAPLEAQQLPASVEQPINQVADLETILQERDACGVSGSPFANIFVPGPRQPQSLSSPHSLFAGRLHRQPEEPQEPHRCGAGRLEIKFWGLHAATAIQPQRMPFSRRHCKHWGAWSTVAPAQQTMIQAMEQV